MYGNEAKYLNREPLYQSGYRTREYQVTLGMRLFINALRYNLFFFFQQDREYVWWCTSSIFYMLVRESVVYLTFQISENSC